MRLIVLKNHLKDYVYKIESHLSVSDDNFDIAMGILNREFLDKRYIETTVFKSKVDGKPFVEVEYNSVKMFLTKLIAQIHELKNSFALNILSEDSPSNRLGEVISFSINSLCN